MAKINANIRGFKLKEEGEQIEEYFDKINKLRMDLDNSDEEQNRNIADLDNRLQEAESNITTLNGDDTTDGSVAKQVKDAVDIEKSNRTAADNTLQTNINNEATARENADDAIANGTRLIKPNLSSQTQYSGTELSAALDFLTKIARRSKYDFGYTGLTFEFDNDVYLGGDANFDNTTAYSGFSSLAAMAEAIATLNGGDTVEGSVDKKVKDAKTPIEIIQNPLDIMSKNSVETIIKTYVENQEGSQTLKDYLGQFMMTYGARKSRKYPYASNATWKTSFQYSVGDVFYIEKYSEHGFPFDECSITVANPDSIVMPALSDVYFKVLTVERDTSYYATVRVVDAVESMNLLKFRLDDSDTWMDLTNYNEFEKLSAMFTPATESEIREAWNPTPEPEPEPVTPEPEPEPATPTVTISGAYDVDSEILVISAEDMAKLEALNVQELFDLVINATGVEYSGAAKMITSITTSLREEVPIYEFRNSIPLWDTTWSYNKFNDCYIISHYDSPDAGEIGGGSY